MCVYVGGEGGRRIGGEVAKRREEDRRESLKPCSYRKGATSGRGTQNIFSTLCTLYSQLPHLRKAIYTPTLMWKHLSTSSK